MSCGRQKTHRKRYLAPTDQHLFEAVGDWIPAAGISDVRFSVWARRPSNATFKMYPAIQTAEVLTSSPGAWTPLAGSLISIGTSTQTLELTPDIPVSSYTASVLWVRFGLAYCGDPNPAGPLGIADVEMSYGYDACGQIVDSHQFEASTTSTSETIEAVTDWIEIHSLDTVIFGINVAGSAGTIEHRPMFQTAIHSTDVPDAWSPGITTYQTGNYVSADTFQPATTGKFWIRFGYGFRTTSGAAGTATISTTVAVKRS